MTRLQNSAPASLLPWQHSRVCLFVALILFLMAAASVMYWNESAHYHFYLALGLLFAAFGIAPLVMHALHKSR
jgi:hypothetical protein